MKKFEGMNVLITGGSRGIGLSTAQLFAMHGAKVLSISRTISASNTFLKCGLLDELMTENSTHIIEKDIEMCVKKEFLSTDKTLNSCENKILNKTSDQFLDEDKSNETINRIFSSEYSNLEFLNLDARYQDSWKRIMNHIKNFYSNKLNILVNNAGIHGFDLGEQNPEYMLEETFDTVISNNLKSVFWGCKTAISFMKNNGGVIINVGSRSGLSGSPNIAAYGISKAGIDNYSKSVALYCASKNYNIRCVCIAPALIDTEMLDPIVGSKNNPTRNEKLNDLINTIPLKKIGKTTDVANLICFLASKEAEYITGTTITIDGGIMAGTVNSPKKA